MCLDAGFVKEAVEHHEKLLTSIEDTVHVAPYLAGDAYALADVAVIPYIPRLELLGLSGMWDRHPGIASWWERVRRRPSTEEAIFERMTDADAAPFPWPRDCGGR